MVSFPDPNSPDWQNYNGSFFTQSFTTVATADGTGRVRIDASVLKKLVALVQSEQSGSNPPSDEGWEQIDISGQRFNLTYTPYDYFSEPILRSEINFRDLASNDPSFFYDPDVNILHVNDQFVVAGESDDDPQLVQPEVNGLISDAMSGAHLTGATIKVRAGLDTQSGPVLQDELLIGAAYRIQLDAGDYTLEFSANGYVTAFLNVTLAAEQILGSQNAELYPREYTENLPGTIIPITFVYVEPGTFEMGVAGAETSLYGSNGMVTLTEPFYLGKYEITQAQWEAVTGSNPSNFDPVNSPNLLSGGVLPANTDNFPVERVSWSDIQNVFLPAINGSSTLYGLPNEAQWEWAARGGLLAQQAGEDFLFSGSNDINVVAWYVANSGSVLNRRTQEVGTKAPNQLGMYDMSGNVLELTTGISSSYTDTPKTDPVGNPSILVFRGGAYSGQTNTIEVIYRQFTGPLFTAPELGFRLLRTLD